MDDISIGELFQALVSGWFIFLICVGLSLGGAVYYLRVATPVYQSELTLFVITTNTNPSAMAFLAGGSKKTNPFQTNSDLKNTIISILESARLQSMVIPSLRHFFSGKTDPEIEMTLKLKRNVSVSYDSKNVFHIQCRNADPQVTVGVVNEYAQALQSLVYAFEMSSDAHFLKILDRPTLPQKPVWPIRSVTLAAAVLGGVSIGAFLSLALEFIRKMRR